MQTLQLLLTVLSLCTTVLSAAPPNATIVRQFPNGTALENLAIRGNGAILAKTSSIFALRASQTATLALRLLQIRRKFGSLIFVGIKGIPMKHFHLFSLRISLKVVSWTGSRASMAQTTSSPPTESCLAYGESTSRQVFTTCPSTAPFS